MISIPSYYAGIVSSNPQGRLSAQGANTAGSNSTRSTKMDSSVESNGTRSFISGIDTKADSISGSAIYEPNGLLADLSGAGSSQQLLPATLARKSYQATSQSTAIYTQSEEKSAEHTFEIIA